MLPMAEEHSLSPFAYARLEPDEIRLLTPEDDGSGLVWTLRVMNTKIE